MINTGSDSGYMKSNPSSIRSRTYLYTRVAPCMSWERRAMCMLCLARSKPLPLWRVLVSEPYVTVRLCAWLWAIKTNFDGTVADVRFHHSRTTKRAYIWFKKGVYMIQKGSIYRIQVVRRLRSTAVDVSIGMHRFGMPWWHIIRHWATDQERL